MSSSSSSSASGAASDDLSALQLVRLPGSTTHLIGQIRGGGDVAPGIFNLNMRRGSNIDRAYAGRSVDEKRQSMVAELLQNVMDWAACE